MHKVIVFDLALAKGIIAEGETDGRLTDKYYIKVNGELYHQGCVMLDSSEARCALELVVKATKAAEEERSYALLLSSCLLGHYKVE